MRNDEHLPRGSIDCPVSRFFRRRKPCRRVPASSWRLSQPGAASATTGSTWRSRSSPAVPDDRAAGLRHAGARLRARQAVRRAEIAQALHLVVPRRGRVPRGGDQPDPRRPGARDRSRASCGSRRASTCAAGSTPPSSPSIARRAGKATMPSTRVNPLLEQLQPYPFEKLRALFAGITPTAALAPINLSIGEPKHPTPALIKDALAGAPRRPRGLSADRRHAGAAPGDRRLAGAALRHPGARPGDAGAAGQRLARSAVRVRADGDRPDARGARWSARTRSTRSTKARRCSPGADARVYRRATSRD